MHQHAGNFAMPLHDAVDIGCVYQDFMKQLAAVVSYQAGRLAP